MFMPVTENTGTVLLSTMFRLVTEYASTVLSHVCAVTKYVGL